MRTALLTTAWLVAAGLAFAAEQGVTIEHPWARATPGGAKVGAAYLTITSDRPDRLLGAASPAAGRVEMHTMTMDGSIMRMRPVDAIPVGPGQPAELKPGGYHLMLMDLKAPLVAGSTFPLTLSFEKSGERSVTVAVGVAGATSAGDAAGAAPAGTGH